MQASTRRRWAIGLGVLAGLVAIYAAAGFLLLPHLAQRSVQRYGESVGRHAEARVVRFNPFTGVLVAEDVTLKERDGRPVVAAARLLADFEFTSLFHRGWRFAAVELDGADVHVEIGRDGRLNLAQLAPPREAPAQPQAENKLPEVTVDALKIDRALVHYADRSRAQPVTAELGPLSVQATGLSTAAGEAGQFSVSANLPQGAALAAKGNASLQPLAIQGDVRLTEFKLATAWPFLRERLRLVEPQGVATLQATYRYEHKDKTTSFAVSDAALTLKNVKLATPEGPLLELEAAHAAKARYDGSIAALAVGSIELARGRYVAAIDPSGRFNWAQLTTEQKTKTPPATWNAHLQSVKLTDIAVCYEDRSRATPLLAEAGTGNAGLALTITSGRQGTRVTADDIKLALQNVSVKGGSGGEPVLKAAGASASGRIDTQERVIAASAITVNGAETALVRNNAGEVPLLTAFRPARPAEAPSGASPWRFRIGEAAITDSVVSVGDAAYEPALRYDLQLERIAAKNILPGESSPITFDGSVKVRQGGALKLSGTAAQDFSRASAKMELNGLTVQPVQGILAKYTTLAVRSGEASGSASLEYARDAKPMLRVGGAARVAALALDDARTGQRFLAWKQLSADGLTLTLAPNRLDIKEAVLDAPETAILISKDRKVNLAQVVRESPAGAKGAAAAAESAAAKAQSEFPVRVGRLRLQNATLDFADASLVLPFSTRVTRLNGTVVGLSTDEQSRAELKFGGRIEPSGYASAEGGVNLRHPTGFMDINVKFQNVEMPPLSPYTATFAGRKIAGGRLWLDLDYKITDKQLSGANRILLENVQLGERVDAPNAMDLPLDLAIALLKDPQGRINMTVPVSGDVGSPHFDYGSLIREAIASAIGRIVTAPFRALASLFGGAGSDELGKVRFSPGSARIYPPERESLQKVAKGLESRPQLKVTVHGPIDPQRDADRLKRAAVRRDLAQAMGQALQAGEDLGPVALSDPETQRAIEKLYASRAGAEAVRAFAKAHAGDQPKSGSAQAADDRRGYYEAMYDELVKTYPLADGTLEALASDRAQAIAKVLRESGLDESRVSVGEPRTVKDTSEPTIDAELALAAR